MAEKSPPNSPTSFFLTKERSFARVSRWESFTSMRLTTLPANLDQAISEPVKHLYEDYRRGVSEQTGRDVNLDAFRPLRPVLTAVKASAIWIEIAFLDFLGFLPAVQSLAPCRLPGFLALVFFLAPGGNAITVAMVHALDNSRYRGSYGPLLLFALAAFALFLRGNP